MKFSRLTTLTFAKMTLNQGPSGARSPMDKE
jgi:hypothetical protein